MQVHDEAGYTHEDTLPDGSESVQADGQPNSRTDTHGPGGIDHSTVDLVGEQIGHYVVLGVLGRGGMGVVHAAYDRKLDRKVAIKTLRAEGGSRLRLRLEREAKAMAKLTHPNVVQVYEIGEHEQASFIVMEYVEGMSLRRWLTDRSRSLTDILAAFMAAGRGLAAVHEAGLIHRDFKPDNVMVRASGQVLVMDLGIAHGELAPVMPELSAKLDEQVENLTRTGALMGSPGYMAPEQFLHKGVTAKSDQFSFCVALWEALYGERPFAGDTMFALLTAVTNGTIRAPKQGQAPPWLRRALERGLAVEPERRFDSMAELLDTLDAGLRSKPWQRGPWWQVGLGGVATAAVAAGLIALGDGAHPPETTDDALAVPDREWPATTDAEELAAFTKLYGFVRYFHPSDAAADADWDMLAIAGAHEVVAGDDQGELREALQRFVDPIAPTVRIQLDGEPAAAIDLTGEGPTVAWQHLGHGVADHPMFVSSRSARFELPVAEAWAPVSGSIDATPLRGKKIRLDARVRVEGGEAGKSQLWLRVDVGTRGMGFFDNMEDRPIRSSEWATYSIQGDVSNDATQVVFGGMARGNATVWFDDFSLTILEGKDAGPAELPNPGFELGTTEGWGTNSREYAYDVVDDQGNKTLRMQRKSVLFESMPESGEILDLPLAAGLRVRLPVALPDSLAKGSMPNQVYAVPSGDDPAVRAAAVIVTWNVMRHFHPYLDEIDQDWDAVLDTAIGDLLDDRNSDDLQLTLERMVAKLGDGLAEVEGPVARSVVPVEFARIEGKVIVTAVREGSRVQVGDELVAIDGVAIETVLTEATTRVGGSPGQIDVRLLRQAGVTRGPGGEQVELKLQRDGNLRSQPPAAESITVELAREAERGAFPVARPAIEVYEDGVVYVDLVRAPWTEIGPRLAEIAAAPGVVFDVRGRPNYNLDIIHHLRATSSEGVEWDFVPEVIYPNQQRIGWDGHASNWDPAQPRITGKVVFVIDARASYSGETLLGFVEGERAMQFVGAPTAGANGDRNTVEVPGGFKISFAGTKVKRLDGRPHHLIGIVPTIPVEPTLAGFLAGRDELLEVALATARRSE